MIVIKKAKNMGTTMVKKSITKEACLEKQKPNRDDLSYSLPAIRSYANSVNSKSGVMIQPAAIA